MASAVEIHNNEANGSRLSRLLVNKGTEALRAAFDSMHRPSQLASVIKANEKKLKKLRYKVINPSQWKLLYPPSGSPDSQNFDVTLLTILLRNICGLASPATGWDDEPPDSDTSVAANIARIKFYRNMVHAHITTTEIPDNEFENLWQKISQALEGLGTPKSDVDQLKDAPLTPEEADYIQQLEDWFKKEAKLIEISLHTNSDVKDVLAEVRKLQQDVEQMSCESEKVSEIDKLGKCNFSGDVTRLSKMFSPGTRKWLFHKLDTWFSDKDSDSTVMILTAGPGIGKSMFAAKVCQLYAEREQLAACHFCKYNNSDYKSPRMVIESLASNMCDNVNGFNEKLAEQLKRAHSENTLSDIFRVLLNDPLHALEEREPMLLVIDALDESQVDSRSDFLELISEEFPKLPQWIKILITSRPELPVQEKLQDFNPVVITPHDANNQEDLVKYLRDHLSAICDSDSVLQSLALQCKGSFLFAFHAQMELKKSTKALTKENLSVLVPKGMSGFYEKQFKRLRDQLCDFALSKINLKSFLQVLVAAKGPLPLSLLPECLGLPGDAEYEVRRAINEVMSTILPVYDDCLIVYHKSLIDWLKSDGYKEHALTVDSQRGHKFLWRACQKVFSEVVSRPLSELESTPLTQYALVHGISHMILTADEASYGWSVDLKIVHCRTIIPFCQHREMVNEWLEIVENSSSKLSSVLLHDLKWHISLFKTVFGLAIEMFKNCALYLQSVANRIDFVGNNCEKRSTARALLKEGRYFWFEDLDATELTNHFSSSVSLRTDVTCIGVSRDEQLVAVGHKDGWISILKPPEFEEVHVLNTILETKNDHWSVFCPNKSMLLYDRKDRSLGRNKNKDFPFFGGDYDALWSCAFSPSGNRLITCDGSEEIKLWDVNSRDFLARLKAGGPVDCCSFSECGLFILASEERNKGGFSSPFAQQTNDVFTAWNALTLQRVDRRSACREFTCLADEKGQFVLSYNGSMIDVFHLAKALSSIDQVHGYFCPFLLPVTKYHWRDCILYHTSKSIELTQVGQLETLARDPRFGMELVHGGQPISFVFCQCCYLKETRVVPVKVQGVYVVPSFAKLHIFNVADQTSIVSSISQPYSFYRSDFYSFVDLATNCCCFSLDGSFLATCTNGSPSVIFVWDTKHCKIVQDIRLPLSSVRACWWSERFFWIYDGRLVKIPVSKKRPLDPSVTELVKVSWKPTNLLTFSDVLIFIDESSSANVLRIVDGMVHYIEKLPVNDSVVCAAVSPCNSVILVASWTTIYICKEAQAAGSLHWVTSIATNFPDFSSAKDSESADDQVLYEWYEVVDCCITSDGTKGVFSFWEYDSNLSSGCAQFLVIVDLSTGKITEVRNTSLRLQIILHAGKSYCIAKNSVLGDIIALNLTSGRVIAEWKTSCGNGSAVILVCCKNDMFAVISKQRATVEFLRLRIPEQ